MTSRPVQTGPRAVGVQGRDSKVAYRRLRGALWKFRKEEVAKLLARMERLKSLVNIALEMDHL